MSPDRSGRPDGGRGSGPRRLAQVGLAAATGAAVVGLALALRPGLAPAADLPGVLAGVVALVVGALGGVAVAGWIRSAGAGGASSAGTASDVRVPGTGFDELLGAIPGHARSAGNRRLLKAQAELDGLTEDVLVRYRGYGREEAAAAVDAGQWRQALGVKRTPSERGPTEAVVDRVRGRSKLVGDAAERTAALLAVVTGGDGS